MGNVFDKEEPAQDENPKRSQGKAMKASYYITKQEREHLMHLYPKLVQKDLNGSIVEVNTPFLTSLFASVLPQLMIPAFIECIQKENVLLTYESFENFIVDCTRISSTTTLMKLWSISLYLSFLPSSDLKLKTDSAANTVEPVSHLDKFCSLLLLLASPIPVDFTFSFSSDLQTLLKCGRKLKEFYCYKRGRGGGGGGTKEDEEGNDDIVLIQGILPIIHQYSSHAHRPLQTMLTSLFFALSLQSLSMPKSHHTKDRDEGEDDDDDDSDEDRKISKAKGTKKAKPAQKLKTSSSSCGGGGSGGTFKPYLAPSLVESSDFFPAFTQQPETEKSSSSVPSSSTSTSTSSSSQQQQRMIEAACDIAFLAMHAEDSQGVWKRLYTLTSDGMSFNRLEHAILGYDGPTVLLVRDAVRVGGGGQGGGKGGREVVINVMGAMVAERWKESNKCYGSSKSCLFTLSPHYRLYTSRCPSNGNYQYLNSSSFNYPHGLGLGGQITPSQPGGGATGATGATGKQHMMQAQPQHGFRFFLGEELEMVIARAQCLTYEVGKLYYPPLSAASISSNTESFTLGHLEIWGTGGLLKVQTGLSAQVTSRQTLAQNIEKARKVDKAQFFNNGFDREFLLANTFSHQREMQDHQVEGVLEDDGKASGKG